MRLLFLFFAMLLPVAVATAAENWPEFRGPRGDGTSTAIGLSTVWSESEHVRWKTPIHGRGWSSPVVWDRQIWMTTATPDGKQLFAVCVDRQSGKITHDLLVFEIAEPQFRHAFNSYASPTPAIEEGRVYVHFGSPGTACIDTETGKILWTRQDLPCNHFRGAGSSPILYDNLLVVAYDGFDFNYVVAFDKLTGKTVWQRDRNIAYENDDGDQHKAYCTARVVEIDGKPQLVYPSAGATIAYEPRTGEEIWRVRHGGMNAASRPLFGDGRFYLNTADGGFKLFALRRRQRRHYRHPRRVEVQGGGAQPAVAIADRQPDLHGPRPRRGNLLGRWHGQALVAKAVGRRFFRLANLRRGAYILQQSRRPNVCRGGGR